MHHTHAGTRQGRRPKASRLSSDIQSLQGERVLVPAGLLALLANDYEGVGGMLFLPTTFQIFGILLLISAPIAALAAQSVAKAFSQRARAEPR